MDHISFNLLSMGNHKNIRIQQNSPSLICFMKIVIFLQYLCTNKPTPLCHQPQHKVKATIPLTRCTLVQRRRGQFIHKFL